jgi:hypothetical protein
MEQLSLFENQCYPDTRPMMLLNTSKDKYLDNATLEVINEYFAVEGMYFGLDPEDEDCDEYLDLYNKVKAILSTWDFYQYSRDMSQEEITGVFTMFSASVINSCYLYVEDHDDDDYEENEEFTDFIDRINLIAGKYYEALLNEWFQSKKLNPVIECKKGTIIKYNNRFYKIWVSYSITKSYWLTSKCAFRYLVYLEDFHKVKIYSKRRYYFVRLFSKALFSGIKSFFKKGVEEFNREINRI